MTFSHLLYGNLLGQHLSSGSWLCCVQSSGSWLTLSAELLVLKERTCCDQRSS